MHQFRKIFTATFGVAVCVVSTWLVATPARSASLADSDSAIVNTGRHIYLAKCAVCHGDDAKGDGPFANLLTVRPSDLTIAAKNNDGVFPFWELFEIISGSELLPAHGGRDMPIWGQEFAAESETTGLDAATFARGRMFALIAYLTSVQSE